MSRDRAAYMREYRARKRVDMTTVPGRIAAAFDIVEADIRIRELEEEVRHLKAQLAKRPPVLPPLEGRFADRYDQRPVLAVPKVRR